MVVVDKKAFEELLSSMGDLSVAAQLLLTEVEAGKSQEELKPKILEIKVKIKQLEPYQKYYHDSIQYLEEERHILQQIVEVYKNMTGGTEIIKFFEEAIKSLTKSTVKIEADIKYIIEHFSQAKLFDKGCLDLLISFVGKSIEHLQEFRNISFNIAQTVTELQDSLKKFFGFLEVLRDKHNAFLMNFTSWLVHYEKEGRY